MKAVIVEDDFIIADHLRLMLGKQGIHVVEMVDNVQDALKTVELKPDIYFVDIRLDGEKSGVDLGIALHQLKIPFVYVTANNEMNTLKEAAKSAPLAYITKPYKENDIIALLEIVKSDNEQTVAVKTKYGKKQIKLSSITYVQSKGSYVEISTNEGAYVERNSLTDMEELGSGRFIRVHRSYLVNKEHISQYNAKYVFIKEQAIPVSRAYKHIIKEHFKSS